MKVLLSAFSCAPNHGSEPGVGWSVAWHLAQRHRVHVLTHGAHRAAIEAHMMEHGRDLENLTFSYFGPSRPYYAPGVRAFLVQFEYHHWQSRIASRANAVIREFAPDVVHHVTLVRYWTPSSLARLDLPFVFGPVGGADRTPSALIATYSLKDQVLERVRALVQTAMEWHPALRATAARASVALGTTRGTAVRLTRLGARRVHVLGESALPSQDIALLGRPATQSRNSFLVSARLLHWKGVHLALEAFALAIKAQAGLTLEIFGNGREDARLRLLARKLGIERSVAFHGAVPRATYLERLQGSLALVHASLHDSGGWVCVEAMAAGVPVVCLNVGGPATQVTPGTGIVVEPSTPAETIASLADAMLRLAADGGLRDAMGAAGKRRVAEHYTWETRIDRLEVLYREAIHAFGAS